MDPADGSRLYDQSYYACYGSIPYGHAPQWTHFFGQMADRIVSDIRPTSVLDAGCAMGLLVEALRDRGVEAYGIDISEYAISQVRSDLRPHCRVASLVETLDRSYDLIVSLEVLEHMSPGQGQRAIDNLCAHTEDVIFSSTPDEYTEPTHVNVQPAEHWAELFARNGFWRDCDYELDYIAPWAARFRKLDEPPARIIRGYERVMGRLAAENRQLRGKALEQTRIHDETARLKAQIEAMRQTRGWRVLERLRGLRKRLGGG